MSNFDEDKKLEKMPSTLNQNDCKQSETHIDLRIPEETISKSQSSNPKQFKRKKCDAVSSEVRFFDVMTKHFEKRNTDNSIEGCQKEGYNEDKLFCLSLAKEVNKIPEDYKLDAKADILHTIQKWQKKAPLQNHFYLQNHTSPQVPQMSYNQYKTPIPYYNEHTTRPLTPIRIANAQLSPDTIQCQDSLQLNYNQYTTPIPYYNEHTPRPSTSIRTANTPQLSPDSQISN